MISYSKYYLPKIEEKNSGIGVVDRTKKVYHLRDFMMNDLLINYIIGVRHFVLPSVLVTDNSTYLPLSPSSLS